MAEWVEDKGWTIDDESPIHGEWVKAFREMVALRQIKRLRKSTRQMLGGKYIRFWKKGSADKPLKLEQVYDRRGYIFSKFNRVGSVNDRDRTYSAMEAADLFFIMWEAYKVTGEKEYLKLARYAGDVLLDDYDKGGLRLGKGWFAAQTSRSQKDIGLTLNKHLVAIRNLWVVGSVMNDSAYTDQALKSVAFTVEGPGWDKKDEAPNIYNYVPRNASGVIPNSWLYYGMGKGEGYFLSNNPWKNSAYHLFDMELIHRIAMEMGWRFPINSWKATAPLGGQSILKRMGDAYRMKEKYGLYVNHSPPSPGNFVGLNKDRTDPLYWSVSSFFA